MLWFVSFVLVWLNRFFLTAKNRFNQTKTDETNKNKQRLKPNQNNTKKTHLQIVSTAASCAVSTGPLLEKSKRSLGTCDTSHTGHITHSSHHRKGQQQQRAHHNYVKLEYGGGGIASIDDRQNKTPKLTCRAAQ